MIRCMLAALVLLVPLQAAWAGDTDIGCGPGTQIWEGNKGVLPKVLGATTNGTLGLQTFGITFGTLGCNQGGEVRSAALLHFASGNLDQIARDMARGEGEYLEAFALLLGVEEPDRPAFYAFAKGHFAEIFAGEGVTEYEVVASVNRLLAQDPALAIYAEG